MTSTRISDLLLRFEEARNTPVMPLEDTPEYQALAKKRRQCRLAKAGIRGAYRQAKSELGDQCFKRFEQGKGTYLFGLPGRGKTWAAASCVITAINHGYTAKLIGTAELLGEVKDEFTSNHPIAIRNAKAYDLLVLDDFGMERPTEWAMETLSALIDARVSAGKPTVITSNYSLGELRNRWGGIDGARLVSRIGGACERVEVKGKDRRIHGCDEV